MLFRECSSGLGNNVFTKPEFPDRISQLRWAVRPFGWKLACNREGRTYDLRTKSAEIEAAASSSLDASGFLNTILNG